MAQGPSDTILVAIRITLQIRKSKVRNPDPPDRRRFVLSEHIFLFYVTILTTLCVKGLTVSLNNNEERQNVVIGSRALVLRTLRFYVEIS